MSPSHKAKLMERLVVLTNGTVRPEDIITTEIVPVAPQSVPVLVVSIVFTVLCTTWTFFRLWAGRKRGKPLHVEDYLAMLSLICFYGLAVCNFLVVYLGGSGHHILTLQPYHVSRMSRVVFAIQVLFAVCLGSVKIGLCFMLKRIFMVQTFHIVTWLVMTMCITWVLFTIIIGFTICQPVAMNWDPMTPGGTCGNQLAGFAAVGILDLVTDGALLTLPIPMVIKLQMRWQHKIALISIFGAGALTMIFAGKRLYAVLALDFLDITYSQVPVILYGTLEPAIAIMVSCSILLQPLFDVCFRSLSSVFSNRKTTQSAGPSGTTSFKTGQSGPNTNSRIYGRGFSQIDERDDDDLELDRFRKTTRDIVVAAHDRTDMMGDSKEDNDLYDGGSESGLRIQVVDTLDITRSDRGQHLR